MGSRLVIVKARRVLSYAHFVSRGLLRTHRGRPEAGGAEASEAVHEGCSRGLGTPEFVACDAAAGAGARV